MLAIRTITGSSAAVTQTLCGPQRARDAPGDDRLLLAVLGRAQELLAEVVVDGGVGAAARRAGERERRRAQALAADEQLGAGGDERGVAAAGAEDVAARERLAQHAEDRGGVVRRAARGPATSRASTTFSSVAGADALDRARDGAPRSARAASRWRRGSGPTGSGSSSGSGAVAQLVERARSSRASRSSAVVVGRGERRERQPHVVAAARERDLGHVQRRRREAGPVRRRAAVGREGEAADRDRAARRAGRPAGRRRRSRGQRAPARARRVGEAVRARAPRARRTQPSAASAAPSRSGCSKQNHGSPARRDASGHGRRVDVARRPAR